MIQKFPWFGSLASLIVVVGLPLAGQWARRHAEPGCALDGVRIDPRYRVEVVDSQGKQHEFCCPRCTQLWLQQQPLPPQTIRVTDEASGETLDAAAAWYVRSFVVTMPA